MSNVATNVSTGKPRVSGAVFRAPVGTALPTDAAAELNAAFKPMGFISEDGLANDSSITSDEVKAWGGVVVYSSQTDRADKFKYVCLESMNLEVLKAYYGDSNVTGTLDTGIHIKANSEELGDYSWVFDMILRGGVLKRIVVPNARLSETGEVVYKDNEPIGYPMTLTASPDANGDTHHEYIKKPA